MGEVYNIGGGRQNNISILETIELLETFGFPVDYQISDVPRKGDHICYVSDLTKVASHYPEWEQEYTTRQIVEETIEQKQRAASVLA